ncbi:carbohydrate kinase family protein [Escherichia coli]|nr:carbohydrate kinase family protein [Escherichia coli]EHH4405559.1 carbohydrate kinase family protein [Escherichia coli]EJX7442841.1 carbohydrate kinase family protein [Escherichia coli]
MKKFDVAALGSGNIDIFLSIPSLPTRGGKVVGTHLGEQAGGTVANSACAMGQLGLNVVSVSCVGNDHSASIILDGFKKYHVNCDFVQVIPELIANTAIIFIDELGEKTLVYSPGSDHEWDKEKALQAIAQSRYYYTMPADIEKFRMLAEYSRSQMTKVVVDIEPHIIATPEHLARILHLADIAIFNYDGFIRGYAAEPDFTLLHDIQDEYQLEAVVVTLDVRGVIAVKGNEQVKIGSYTIPIIDTTGAGDTFNGAFVYSLIKNMPLIEALKFASATAAINITALGARGHLATPSEVNLFLSQHD